MLFLYLILYGVLYYNTSARYWLELDSYIAPALQKCVEFRSKNNENIHHWNNTISRQQRCHLRHMDYIVKQLVDIIIFLLTLAMVTFHSTKQIWYHKIFISLLGCEIFSHCIWFKNELISCGAEVVLEMKLLLQLSSSSKFKPEVTSGLK